MIGIRDYNSYTLLGFAKTDVKSGKFKKKKTFFCKSNMNPPKKKELSKNKVQSLIFQKDFRRK